MTAAHRLLRGSGSNVVRIACTSIAALLLPPLLTRLLAADEYSAWVTLLQVSTYVGLLDLGLQTVVARFVAEHHAIQEFDRALRVLATAIRMLVVGALVGCVLVGAAVASLPSLFPEMPAALHADARVSLLIVGLSAALSLPFGPFASAFIGLQRYGFPTALAVASRLVQAGAVVLGALIGGGLVAMAIAIAATNALTALVQYLGWRRLVWPELGSGRGKPDRATARLLLSTGSIIALWLLGGLFVNGLDTVIVGRFDFPATGAFATAVVVVNFLISVLSGLFSPLMPAAAALHGPNATPDTASLTLRATRYSTLVIVTLGVLLCIFAFPILALWVGPSYAEVGAPLLRLLVLGHAVRQLGYAYSLVVVARGQQRPATIATMAEAVVNLIASVALAQVLGAAGVAIGTVIGAAVSIALHFAISMRFTRTAIPVRRSTLGVRGMLIPAMTLLPMLVVLPSFDGRSVVPAAPVTMIAGAAVSALAVARLGLDSGDRGAIVRSARRIRRVLSRATHAF